MNLKRNRVKLGSCSLPLSFGTNPNVSIFEMYIYIYAFSRCFYPKRLTVHSGYTCFITMCVPWESNPQPFALLTQCSTTEPQEQKLMYLKLNYYLLGKLGFVFHTHSNIDRKKYQDKQKCTTVTVHLSCAYEA